MLEILSKEKSEEFVHFNVWKGGTNGTLRGRLGGGEKGRDKDGKAKREHKGELLENHFSITVSKEGGLNDHFLKTFS